ncbi:acyl-CoA dehydrogenase family protein [Ottowia caeni]|uniref:acyl-CoA dehydrogenase family protein n=1 Tax=Ottowia caeni TaxID=2870339 RepID=UPI001E36DEF9|nr:acyl-CoA dehydrogenase family protein [Ottowia caeni]
MDLRFRPEQEAFRAQVREWVSTSLPADLPHKVLGGYPLGKDDYQRWARILGEKGWLCYGWPKEYGGPGWSAIEQHLFSEECAGLGAPPVLPFGPSMLAPVLMTYGTAEQKQRFLPGIASGEVWWCQGYSEPGAGSDLANLKTQAVRVGDKYVVNGQKTWTTLGQHADWIFCLVRTSNEGKPQSGISFLLIDMRSPGVTVRPIKLMDGEYDVNEVWFDNVEVSVEQRIGEENKGWACAKLLLGHERVSIANVARAKRELSRLKKITQSTGNWGNVRWRDQIAWLEIDVVALEMLVWRVLSEEGSGKVGLDIAGLLKIKGSEIQQRCSELLMLVAGPETLPFAPRTGAGSESLAHDVPGYELLAPSYFNMRKTTIYGGSNEVQRNIVAQTLFG